MEDGEWKMENARWRQGGGTPRGLVKDVDGRAALLRGLDAQQRVPTDFGNLFWQTL
jgi:hypothetical protein